MAHVAVIMTVYNCENYIGLAISSILTQTFKDFEFIIVDDGSTDRTKELITAFDDPRIQFYSISHIGRARALNYAIGKAQSPYIAFMDADDISVPERLAVQVTYLGKHSEIGAVSGWYQTIDASGNNQDSIHRLPSQHAEIEREMTKHCSLSFPALLVRKAVLDIVGIFNEGLQSAIDYEYFLRLLPVTNVANIPALLLYHRRHRNSITTIQLRDQQRNTHELAERYLLNKLNTMSTGAGKNSVFILLGINEYYYGSMQNVRRWFSEAGAGAWNTKSFWRYYFPSLLGDTFFRIYRNIRNC
jgi:glycosyltransferase involved in cell wall biosynthesis